MQRRQFMKGVGASTVGISAIGTAVACKHDHKRNRRKNKIQGRRHNTQPNTAIFGDSWHAVDSFYGKKDYAVTGELKWTGNFTAEVFVTATFYDGRGGVLSSDGIDSLTLAPNETGGFQIDYLNAHPKRVADYQLATEVYRK